MGEKKKRALRIEIHRALKLHFHDPKVTNDAGLPLYRVLDEALGLPEIAEAVLHDTRREMNTHHRMTDELIHLGWLDPHVIQGWQGEKIFWTRAEALVIVDGYRQFDNIQRPHSSLPYRTSAEVARRATSRTEHYHSDS